MGALLSFLFAVNRRPQVWHASSPAYIDVCPSPSPSPAHQNGAPLTNGHAGKPHAQETKKLSVRAFVESKVPSLAKEYHPTWWLPGGHLQTVFCVIGDFTKTDQIKYTRKILTFPDGGSIALDFCGSPSLPPDAPIVVVCHGLAGGSHESYVRNTLDPIIRSKAEGGLGYRGVVVNFRGCGGANLTSSQLYSAGNTNDLRTAVLYLSTRFPAATMVGVGFSLGACVLTRYLGEEGEHSRLLAGIVLGCPWDLLKNGSRLEDNFFIRNTYSRAMGKNLCLIVEKHLPAILAHPRGQAVADEIATLYKFRSPSLKTVDTYVVRHLGGPSPPWPFPTADAYYEWASCHKSVLNIRVPFLAVNASDDPIILGTALPVQEIQSSPWAVLAVTRGGGHLGWFTGGGNPPRRWIQPPILEWLRATIEDYVPPPGRTTVGWERRGEYVYELSAGPDIAFHEAPGSEEIEGADELAEGVFAGL